MIRSFLCLVLALTAASYAQAGWRQRTVVRVQAAPCCPTPAVTVQAPPVAPVPQTTTVTATSSTSLTVTGPGCANGQCAAPTVTVRRGPFRR